MILEVEDYHFTILLGNPDKLMLQLNKGYSGDGGIPGYIMLSLLPNDYTFATCAGGISPRVQSQCPIPNLSNGISRRRYQTG